MRLHVLHVCLRILFLGRAPRKQYDTNTRRSNSFTSPKRTCRSEKVGRDPAPRTMRKQKQYSKAMENTSDASVRICWAQAGRTSHDRDAESVPGRGTITIRMFAFVVQGGSRKCDGLRQAALSKTLQRIAVSRPLQFLRKMYGTSPHSNHGEEKDIYSYVCVFVYLTS